jgi:hypothetical protein
VRKTQYTDVITGPASTVDNSGVHGHCIAVLDSSISRAPQTKPSRLPRVGWVALLIRMVYLLRHSASHSDRPSVG